MLGGAATHFALAASFFDHGPRRRPGRRRLRRCATSTVLCDARDRTCPTSSASPAARRSSGRRVRLGPELARRRSTPQLNVFAEFEPKLSAPSRDCDVLFLANIQPELQRDVREQCSRDRFVALDSMNLWIEIARDELVEVIGEVDCLILNDAELRQLTGRPNLVSAAREILGWGPSIVVAKQGEYGAALITADAFFALPAYPAGDRRRSDRRRRHVRRRVRRLPRRPPRRTADRRRAAPGDGLRHRAGVVQRRGVRHRARGTADLGRDPRAGRRPHPHHRVRARAASSSSPTPDSDTSGAPMNTTTPITSDNDFKVADLGLADVRPQGDPARRARDARPDGDAARVRRVAAAARRAHHRLAAHDRSRRRC